MKLLALHYERFRNLNDVRLEAGERTTIAVGENGQGKTNLLEGVFFLATLKALRASRLSELVAFGAASARVTGRFLLRGVVREIAVDIADGTRTAFVDGKRTSSLLDYFGGVSVVAFTPDDLGVVKGAPDERRTLLDRAVFNRYPAYLGENREYSRALKNRNRLLKDRAPVSHLAAWDETLSRAGARLWLRRREVLAEIAPRARAAFESIGRIPEQAQFAYESGSVDATLFASGSEAQLQAALAAALDARLQRDTERGFTTAGPHADDVAITVGGNAARSFASQGQARALVLAWKVAEIENLHAATGVLPLLLLDDVSSELDPERNAFLMSYLAASGAQVLLTTTDAHLVKRAAHESALWYQVSKGQVSRMKTPV